MGPVRDRGGIGSHSSTLGSSANKKVPSSAHRCHVTRRAPAEATHDLSKPIGRRIVSSLHQPAMWTPVHSLRRFGEVIGEAAENGPTTQQLMAIFGWVG